MAKNYRKVLFLAFFVNLIALIGYSYYVFNYKLPDHIKVKVGNDTFFNMGLPLMMESEIENRAVININHNQIDKDKISVDLNKPFSLNVSESGTYDAKLTFLGFTVKEIKVEAIEDIKLMPSGESIGIHIRTNGIMILGTGAITNQQGDSIEPAKGLVKSGDYIQEINGQVVNTTDDMTAIVASAEGEPLQFRLLRDEEHIEVTIKPEQTAANEYKVGIWIRDDTQGIGTLSFVDEDNNFGALGHGITDIDTNLLIDINGGGLYSAHVYSIVKGQNGTPGEMIGNILYQKSERLGNISQNTQAGIYGQLDDSQSALAYDESKALSVGLKQDIVVGKASILCNIDGKVEEYEIQINSIDYNNHKKNKDFIIEITDKRLLEQTNGIVQGMSGSPIIQDGKIVGVVTHVFLNDCKKGYGIFIENMLSNIR